MTNFLVLLIGIAVPGALCWLALLLLEGTRPVLTRAERIVWALTLGPTLFTFIAFLSHVLGLTSLTLVGFLLPNVLVALLLGAGAWTSGVLRSGWNTPLPASLSPDTAPRWMRLGVLLLCIWAAVKILAGAIDLFGVPTYWDDSFNNWNMRGKMFFVSERIELTIPVGNQIVQTEGGVSSYPPALPLVKTWLADLRGSWEEPLVNGVHLLWFLGLLGSFFLLLRRSFSRTVSLLGASLLASLPLLLIQGTNPYADVFLASHLFLSIACLLGAGRAGTTEELTSWLKLLGFTLGLLLFTKNEATVLYAPLLILLAFWLLLTKKRAGLITQQQFTRAVGLCAIILALLALPWLAFKWLNGLTFGNAKSISGMTLSFNPLVVRAIWYHLSHEPNWLLLPLVLPLVLILSGKRAWELPEGLLTVFVVVSILGQFLLFALLAPLATEAIMQTGLSRGLLHVVPVALLLVILLVRQLLLETEKK